MNSFYRFCSQHSGIASSPLVKRYGKVLSDAASEIGSPQIRNLGTIGGNIVNASPAADTIPHLMVLNATGRIVSRKEEKEIPVSQLFKGPYETNLKADEILAQVTFGKLSSDTKCSFTRVAGREAMAISRMSIAIILQTGKGKDIIEDIRTCVGAVTPIPHRMSDAAILKGKSPDEELLRMASRKVSEAMIRWSGLRPSTSFIRFKVQRRCM